MPSNHRGQLLISACLLGEPVRFDGLSKQLHDSRIDRWHQQGLLIPVCPEVLGGLSTPREPAEILAGDGAAVLHRKAKVINIREQDVTQAFINGARRVAALVKQHNIVAALLKRYSPSCGNDQIYDGSFSKRAIPGAGVTASLLITQNIPVYNEDQLDALEQFIEKRLA